MWSWHSKPNYFVWVRKQKQKSNTAKRPFWKRCRWKSYGFYPYRDMAYTHVYVYCATGAWSYYSKPNLSQESGNHKSYMAIIRPFWKGRCWKSTDLCLWPQSICTWILELKVQSKLGWRSGNHVAYRRTEGRTDNMNPVYLPPTSLGWGIMSQHWLS